MTGGKHIVIGVTGGIAAYKAVYLVRLLQQSGAEVRVTMTETATRFVGIETFAALTRHDVPVRIFPENPNAVSQNWTQHIQWAEWADLMVVAPCTANTLAKIVHGFSDSMLTATILASRCPVLLCPTMDGEMYQAASTRANLDKACELGFHLLSPDHGYLASGLHGTGRLPEPDVIMDRITDLLAGPKAPSQPGHHKTEKSDGSERPETGSQTRDNASAQPETGIAQSARDSHAVPEQKDPGASGLQNQLAGKQVLVTCGATREFLDPVRFFSNPSTGKMGMAMAEAAAAFGARVTLLHAESVNTSALSDTINKISFNTTDDLFRNVKARADADVIIMTAAVSDFRPAKTHTGKVKKDKTELQITLERTPDILQWLGDHSKKEQVLIGFAMETEDLVARAREKRLRKGADWIVANDLTSGDSGFAVDTNRVILVGTHDETTYNGPKSDVARSVLRHIFVS